MKAPFLESERLVYKPLSTDHLSQDYVDWLNDPDVNKYLETGGNYSMDMLKDYLLEVENKEILFWAIHLKTNGLHIGNIKIDPINIRHKFGEYGILMGCKSEWGKGHAKEASLRIIDFCFNTINLRKINLGVVEDNYTALNLYKTIGFITEGVYKKHGLYQGKYCNVYRMALFNPIINFDEL